MQTETPTRHGPLIEMKSADITPTMIAAGAAVLKSRYASRADGLEGNIASDVFLAMFQSMNNGA